MKPFVTTMVVAALAFALASSCAFAADEAAELKAASAQEKMAELVKLGPGVQKIKKDKKGRVQSLVVVGQSRISTVLGAAKGKEVARKRAEQSAKAAFVKWLGEAVVICENSENETTMFMQGEESKDKEALSEAGKAVEKNSDSYKSVAAGLVRGLTLLHSDINAEDKEYTVVYGWSLANAKAAKHTATHDPTIKDEGKKATSSEAKEGDESSKSDKKKIHSESSTSPEADDYLK